MACNKLEEIIEFADNQIKKWEKMAEEPSKWDKCFPSQCRARANEAELFRDKVLSILDRIKDIDKVTGTVTELLKSGVSLDLIIERLERGHGSKHWWWKQKRKRDQDNHDG